jgi:hypothetical protein
VFSEVKMIAAGHEKTKGRARRYAILFEGGTRFESVPLQLSTDSHFRTDESGIYWKIGETFASHRTVKHAAGEYVWGDAHTNTVEGYFSIFKRGIYGVYHHVS